MDIDLFSLLLGVFLFPLGLASWWALYWLWNQYSVWKETLDNQ